MGVSYKGGAQSYHGITDNLTGLKSSFKYKNGYYGDGILSRFPIEYSTNYLMPLVNPANEQRGLLCNKISFGTTKLNLFSIHYPTNFEERKLATEELINIIEKIDDNEIIIIG